MLYELQPGDGTRYTVVIERDRKIVTWESVTSAQAEGLFYLAIGAGDRTKPGYYVPEYVLRYPLSGMEDSLAIREWHHRGYICEKAGVDTDNFSQVYTQLVGVLFLALIATGTSKAIAAEMIGELYRGKLTPVEVQEYLDEQGSTYAIGKIKEIA